MAVDGAEFRAAMSRLTAGVSVLTARLDDGVLAGITVTAFCSLSLDPPLVLVCIDRRAFLHDRLNVGAAVAINMLSSEQEAVSRLFASREREPFSKTTHHTGASGAPLLDGSLAALEGRVVERHAGGDHTILVAEVEATALGEGEPLLYYRGSYGRLQ